MPIAFFALLFLFVLLAYGLHRVLSHQTSLLYQILQQSIFNTLQLARLIGPPNPNDPLTVPGLASDSTSGSKTPTVQELATQRINQHRSIIDFSYAGPKLELEDRLRLRALANSRLVKAFGIETSLTSSSVSVHKEFRKLASASINKGNADWQKLYRVAMNFLQKETAHQTIVPLAECVRCLCFIVVLVSQFGVAENKIDKNGVKRITDEINAQWLRSKVNDGTLRRSKKLDEYLHIMFEDLETSILKDTATSISSTQALGLIMPQYETLWRVVLLTYVTAYHRQANRRGLKKRVKDVPACLGNAATEKEALKIAMVRFHFRLSLDYVIDTQRPSRRVFGSIRRTTVSIVWSLALNPQSWFQRTFKRVIVTPKSGVSMLLNFDRSGLTISHLSRRKLTSLSLWHPINARLLEASEIGWLPCLWFPWGGLSLQRSED